MTMEINTFSDWWQSTDVFDNSDLYDKFEKCWQMAQSLELQRCARLSAHRLSWEAQVDKAARAGTLREFLDSHKDGPGE